MGSYVTQAPSDPGPGVSDTWDRDTCHLRVRQDTERQELRRFPDSLIHTRNDIISPLPRVISQSILMGLDSCNKSELVTHSKKKHASVSKYMFKHNTFVLDKK